jgi:hypothetical protein
MTSGHKKTPEQATLGKGAPGDPERMEVDVPGPRYLDVPVAVEPTDAEARPILKFGAGLAVAGVLAVAATLGIFKGLAALERRADPPPPPLARAEGRAFPEPRLQTTPLQDLDAIRAQERDLLDGAGWVDESKGAARIPIDDAIALYVRSAAAGGPMPMAPVSAASPSPSPAPSPAAGGAR